MALAEDIKTQFEARAHHGLLLHAESRFFATYYRDGQMLLIGHLREMPPLILFRGQTIWVSDGETWTEVTGDAGAIALLALLDPRRVVQAATQIIEGTTATVDLKRLLGNAGQTQFHESIEGQTQVVAFTIGDDGTATEMTQPDIGDPESNVTVRFIPGFEAVTLP
jgi:hypothetical protein